MELYGQTINKVYHKKDGSSINKKGNSYDWRLWNIYFDGFDGGFTLFTSGKKPEPFEGMKVAYITYKEETSVSEKDGKIYTNRTIDEFKVSQDSSVPTPTLADTQEQPKFPDSGGSVIKKKEVDWDAIAFKKCKFGFLKEAFVPFLKGEIAIVDTGQDLSIPTQAYEIENKAEEFATMCMRISLDYTTTTQKPSQAKDIVRPVSEPEGAKDDTGAPVEDYEEYPK